MRIVKQSPIHDGLRVQLYSAGSSADQYNWRTVVKVVKTGRFIGDHIFNIKEEAEQDYVKRCIRIAVYS